jgi:hypothetical protein
MGGRGGSGRACADDDDVPLAVSNGGCREGGKRHQERFSVMK